MHPLLRPRWIAGHVLVLITVVAFVQLGMWQLRRHDEKVALRAAVAEAQTLPRVPIEEASNFRRVVAEGRYDGALQTTVLRSQAGVSGYHVLTPFVFDDGVAVLVNRGWIPLDDTAPLPPAGLTRIEGTLWPAEEGSSLPDRLQPAVRRINPEIQQSFADYSFIGGYLLLTAPDEGSPALPPEPDVSLGPHFAYAMQWFLFTAVVLIGYPLLLRRTVTRGAGSSEGGGAVP